MVARKRKQAEEQDNEEINEAVEVEVTVSPKRPHNDSTSVSVAEDEELPTPAAARVVAVQETALVASSSISMELTAAGHYGKKKNEPFLSSPTLLLSGHTEAIYSISFDPTGCYLASGGMDRHIMLWDVKSDGQNYNVLEGHKSAILEVKWTGSRIISCSADKTVAIWDANRGERIRKLTDHTSVVNCCAVAGPSSPHSFASGSDDATVVIWDQRSKAQVQTVYHDYQITSVCMTDDGTAIYSGGIDNIIR